MPALRPLPDYIATERAREAVRQRYAAQDAANSGGVAWSGMGADYRAPKTDAQIEAAAVAQRARDAAFVATPQSRYLAALSAIGHAAEGARACYCRGLSLKECAHAAGQLEAAVAAASEAIKALAEISEGL